MVPDALGFLYPKVDESKCVECGLCEKVCAFNENYDKSLNLKEPEFYGARHKDMAEVLKSQSGGAFVAISDYVLRLGGVVYGVGYEDHFRIAHKRATTADERNEFRGSKYVQSDLSGVFRQVKQDLCDDLIVLFSGTPCQTAGLNSFIGKRLRKNLILIDIICHGVPAPFVWRDYILYLERKHGKNISYVNFRDKRYNWGSHIETYRFEKEKNKSSFTLWTDVFYDSIMLRRSCSKCHYCNINRPSDITIADLWGASKIMPKEVLDHKGCSLMIINTEHGKKIMQEIMPRLNYTTTSFQQCSQGQPNLYHPTTLHPLRDKFENDYAIIGFEDTLKKYGYIGFKVTVRMYIEKIRRECTRRIPNKIKHILHKII